MEAKTPKIILILEDLKLSRGAVNKISQFSVRTLELKKLFDSVRNYFIWFPLI